MAEGLSLLAYCLAVTVIIETIGAFLLFRIRDKDALIDVALAQVVTNPLVEAGTIGAFTFFPNAAILIVAILELAAFVAEALNRYFTKTVKVADPKAKAIMALAAKLLA